jgi:hypothetical protein
MFHLDSGLEASVLRYAPGFLTNATFSAEDTNSSVRGCGASRFCWPSTQPLHITAPLMQRVGEGPCIEFDLSLFALGMGVAVARQNAGQRRNVGEGVGCVI